MTRLTTNPHIAVELLAIDHSYIISTPEAVLLKCTRCGGMKDVSLHDTPTQEELSQGGQLRMGTTSYPFLRNCSCLVKDPINVRSVLLDVRKALERCKTLDEAKTMIRRLIQPEDHAT